MTQRGPAAAARISMQSVSAVPSYSQADNGEEKDEHDDEVELPKRVASSRSFIAWSRGPSGLRSSGKERDSQSA